MKFFWPIIIIIILAVGLVLVFTHQSSTGNVNIVNNNLNSKAVQNLNTSNINQADNLNQTIVNESIANQNQNSNSNQGVINQNKNVNFGFVEINLPISNAKSRITKKPFGIYITPKNSPVQPEKFSGYHTGVDFETLAAEADVEVPIIAIANGKVLVKQFVSGYGGVLIQSATINNQAVTILYGHLKLASINLKVGQQIRAGDKIGILGKGFSSETDGERKHLHLGIHLGASINYRGYVSTQSQLSGWLDAQKLF